MANQKILDQKQAIIDEIADKTKKAGSVILFEYQGLTAYDTNNLRRLLKENGSEFICVVSHNPYFSGNFFAIRAITTYEGTTK